MNLRTKGFTLKTKVYYDSTDAVGIMYHAEYIKICDRARTDILFNNEIFNNMHILVKELSCKFIKPAKLGEEIEVKSTLKTMKNVSFILNQKVFKETLLFDMDIILVLVKDLKPHRIPDNYKNLIISQLS